MKRSLITDAEFVVVSDPHRRSRTAGQTLAGLRRAYLWLIVGAALFTALIGLAGGLSPKPAANAGPLAVQPVPHAASSAGLQR